VNALLEESFEEFFGNVAYILVEFAKQLVYKVFHLQRISVIGMASGEHKIDHMATVAGNQVELKSIKPANRTLSEGGQTVKYFVGVNPPVIAHAKRCDIDKGDTGTLPGGFGFKVDGQRQDHLAAQLGKPVVRNQTRE